MTTDDHLRSRVRATLGALTDHAVPAPTVEALAARRIAGGGRSRTATIGIAVAAAASLASIAVAVVAVTGRGVSGPSESSCADAVRFDGRYYFDEIENRGSLSPDQLGPVLAEVEAPLRCDDQGGGAALPNGVLASTLPVGTELHALPGESDEAVIAAVDSGVVRVFRSYDGDPLAFTSDVTEIRVNSGSGGDVTFAVIDDQTRILQLLADARAEPPVNPGDVDGLAFDYTIVVVRADGFRTSLGYDIDANRLGGRAVGELWAESITAALVASPDQPTVAGYRLVHAGGAAGLHAYGGCRHDRPDLTLSADREVRVEMPPGVQFANFFVGNHRPADGDEAVEPFYRNDGASITLPEFTGTLIVEVSVFLASGDTVNFCATVAAAD